MENPNTWEQEEAQRSGQILAESGIACMEVAGLESMVQCQPQTIGQQLEQ